MIPFEQPNQIVMCSVETNRTYNAENTINFAIVEKWHKKNKIKSAFEEEMIMHTKIIKDPQKLNNSIILDEI